MTTTLAGMIEGYTREAGVRWLEREVGRALRGVAMRIAEGAADHVHITAADLEAVLGPVRFENEVAMRTAVPGVATGLAWTPVGGDILFIEAARTPGGGRLILTGQLGEVMRESAQAALSLVKTEAARPRAWTAPPSRRRTSMCTCRPAPRPRTGQARALRCSSPSPPCSPAARCAATRP